MVQLLKGKGNGARALKWVMGGRKGNHKHPNMKEWLCAFCWTQVLFSQGSPGQLHPAPFSSGSEDNIHSGTQDRWFQGEWKENGMMLWGLV